MNRYLAWLAMMLIMVPVLGTAGQESDPITAEPFMQNLAVREDADMFSGSDKSLFYGGSLRLPVRPGTFREGLLTSRGGMEVLVLPLRTVGFSASLRPFTLASFVDVKDWNNGENRIIMIFPASAGVRWYPFSGPQGLSVQLQWEGMVVTQGVTDGWLFTYHQGLGLEAAYNLLVSETLVYLSAQLAFMPGGTPLGTYQPAVGIGMLW